jgi:predicted RecA/RadA family phage recombinase
MDNFVQEGARLVVAAPAAKTSGDGVMVGAIFGVAITDAANGADVAIQTTGVVTLPKVGSQAWTVGERVYWDDGNGRCTTTVADGDVFVGVATAAVGSGAGDTTGTVRLTASQAPQAASVADASSGSAGEINALRDALVAAGLMAPAA